MPRESRRRRDKKIFQIPVFQIVDCPGGSDHDETISRRQPFVRAWRCNTAVSSRKAYHRNPEPLAELKLRQGGRGGCGIFRDLDFGNLEWFDILFTFDFLVLFQQLLSLPQFIRGSNDDQAITRVNLEIRARVIMDATSPAHCKD